MGKRIYTARPTRYDIFLANGGDGRSKEGRAIKAAVNKDRAARESRAARGLTVG